jgi:Ca2+/Na+ antiporter
MERPHDIDDETPGICRRDYFVCVVAMIVFAFALAEKESNPLVGWLFFCIFICFPTAMRSENLGFSPLAFIALFIPALNLVFALACLAFPQNFATTKRLDAASAAWIICIGLIAFFGGSLWYQHWRAAQPLVR